MPATRRIPGLLLTEHTLDLPLDHDDPTGPTIEVFAREVAVPGGEDRPLLVFLQGGPGSESPRPAARPTTNSWLERALADYRVLLVDQRGTGRSTPWGEPVDGVDPAAEAAWLTHFRADAIVRDVEAFREHLGARRLSVLGQSFGGFCALHYLTVHPDSLDQVYFTGGLPPVGRPTQRIYADSFEAMRERNAHYLRRYPEDGPRLSELVALAASGEVLLPDGEAVTPRLLRTTGHRLGMDGGAEQVHYLLEQDHRSPGFRHDLRGLLPFAGRNPIYSVLHESSYADGVVTGWSAQEVAPADFTADDSILLTAEHLFRWHFTDDPELRPYGEVADLLARHPWPRLYDADRLREVDVPCAASIYVKDPYVLLEGSLETASLLPGMRTWQTDEFLHNGISDDRVLDRLIDLAKGRA